MCRLEDREYLKGKVHQALERLYKYDLCLIKKQGVEWSISARIAMHLYVLVFNNEECSEDSCEYRIDCEYRKMGDGVKTAPEGSPHESMRPDIIIHKRAESDSSTAQGNILFCEVKQGNRDSDDEAKILQAISDNKLQYQYGLHIYNITKLSVSAKWFFRRNCNGCIYKCINEEEITYVWDGSRLREKGGQR